MIPFDQIIYFMGQNKAKHFDLIKIVFFRRDIFPIVHYGKEILLVLFLGILILLKIDIRVLTSNFKSTK